MRAVVVGSGPNGLAGAIHLARAGVQVTVLESHFRLGGALGSAELTEPGLVHDLGASFLPLAASSPFFRSLDLDALGVRLVEAPVALAHPLDDGTAGLLRRDIAATAQGLGVDGDTWQNLFRPFADRFEQLAADTLRPIVRIPKHPALTARFGALASQPATRVAGTFRTDAAKALFTGIAAHAFGRLDAAFSSAIGVMLTAAGHAAGWPVVAGGAQALTDALVAELTRLGGTLETGRTITDLRELDAPDIVLLDVTPSAAVQILHHRIPERFRRAYGQYEHGPAAFKVDFAIDGDIPWTAEGCSEAGVVHLGGSAADIVGAEAQVVSGRSSRHPFTLVGQQYVADPTRSAKGRNPVWAYAHVPAGSTVDATERITRQIERFAPGFRDRIVATHVTSAMGLAAANSNFVGGDINTGANTFRQLIARPVFARNPYRTGVKGVYLCSAATPPGPGVHGMSGVNAAETALAHA